MSITYTNIIQSKFIETTENIQYSVPTGKKCIIDKMTLVNPTATKATATIYLVPFSGTFGDSNIISKSVEVYPSQTIVVDSVSGHLLEAGSNIVAIASALSTISIRASGREIA